MFFTNLGIYQEKQIQYFLRIDMVREWSRMNHVSRKDRWVNKWLSKAIMLGEDLRSGIRKG